MKTILKGKFRALSVYIEREISHSNLAAHKKKLKNKVNTPKRNRRQEITKLRDEISKIETKRPIQRINETKN